MVFEFFKLPKGFSSKRQKNLHALTYGQINRSHFDARLFCGAYKWSRKRTEIYYHRDYKEYNGTLSCRTCFCDKTLLQSHDIWVLVRQEIEIQFSYVLYHDLIWKASTLLDLQNLAFWASSNFIAIWPDIVYHGMHKKLIYVNWSLLLLK